MVVIKGSDFSIPCILIYTVGHCIYPCSCNFDLGGNRSTMVGCRTAGQQVQWSILYLGAWFISLALVVHGPVWPCNMDHFDLKHSHFTYLFSSSNIFTGMNVVNWLSDWACTWGISKFISLAQIIPSIVIQYRIVAWNTIQPYRTWQTSLLVLCVFITNIHQIYVGKKKGGKKDPHQSQSWHAPKNGTLLGYK